MSNKRYRVCKKLKTRKRRQSHRHKQSHKQCHHKQRRHSKTRVIRGGNYDRDFTSTTLEGIATKSPHMYTVAVPGYPVMSGQAYKQLMESV